MATPPAQFQPRGLNSGVVFGYFDILRIEGQEDVNDEILRHLFLRVDGEPSRLRFLRILIDEMEPEDFI